MKSSQKAKMTAWAKRKGIRVLQENELLEFKSTSSRTRNTFAGGFGICELVRRNGELLVLKTMRREKYSGMMREVRGLLRAAGPGVQELYAICPARHVIISKYAGETLSKLIMRGLSKHKSAYILECVMKTVRRVLSEARLCHNDIKPSNICVAKAHMIYPEVTIIDYGLAASIGRRCRWNGMYPHFKEWVAPELMKETACSEITEVYGLGYLGKRLFKRSRTAVPNLMLWFETCQYVEPSLRPKLVELIHKVREYRQSLKRL